MESFTVQPKDVHKFILNMWAACYFFPNVSRAIWDKTDEYAYGSFLHFSQCLFIQLGFFISVHESDLCVCERASFLISIKQFLLKYLIVAETRKGFTLFCRQCSENNVKPSWNCVSGCAALEYLGQRIKAAVAASCEGTAQLLPGIRHRMCLAWHPVSSGAGPKQEARLRQK